MKNLRDLLEHEVKDLFSAEKQLTEALPKMAAAAKNEKLTEAFQSHLEETEGHLERIRQACEHLEINPGNTTCKAMEGLIKEGEDMIKEDADADVKDAGLIACAQRVEHYEIAGYGTAARYAKELGLSEVEQLLRQTLDEEYSADKKLNDLAENRINKDARA